MSDKCCNPFAAIFLSSLLVIGGKQVILLSKREGKKIAANGLRMSSTASSTRHQIFDYFGQNMRLFD